MSEQNSERYWKPEGSPPRGWAEVDALTSAQEILDLLPEISGPQRPFFIRPSERRLTGLDQTNIGKLVNDADYVVEKIMVELGIFPEDETQQVVTRIFIEAANTVYESTYASHAGYVGPKFKTKIRELRDSTADYDAIPLVKNAMEIALRHPENHRNEQAEVITRILVGNELASTD